MEDSEREKWQEKAEEIIQEYKKAKTIKTNPPDTYETFLETRVGTLLRTLQEQLPEEDPKEKTVTLSARTKQILEEARSDQKQKSRSI